LLVVLSLTFSAGTDSSVDFWLAAADPRKDEMRSSTPDSSEKESPFIFSKSKVYQHTAPRLWAGSESVGKMWAIAATKG
jgi:hypothetical protein